MANIYYEESFYVPTASEEAFFGESVATHSYCHTAFVLEAIAPYSRLVAQRFGNNQDLRVEAQNFYGSLVMAGNVTNQTLINGFPSTWPTAPIDTGHQTYEAHRGHATFYDYAYVSVGIPLGADTTKVGDFVGLFTGDIILKGTGWSDWFTITYNTANDDLYWDDTAATYYPGDPDWSEFFN